MQVRLLGPVEVVDDGEPLAIGGAKPQALVAFLALNCGSEVSTDRCVEAVWGDAATGREIRSLQTYVSSLRKVLEPASRQGDDWSIIETTANGYRLSADVETDIALFERLVANAESLVDIAPADARALFDDALSLWRGEPLGAFVDDQWARPHVTALVQARLDAVEGRIRAELALGRHESVVAELETLTKANPYRERIWGLWMLALYGADRQTEALRAFSELRETLVQELGIEPGAEITELEARMLRQDPDLLPAVRLPTNLPAPIASFVGRETEVGEVLGLLRDDQRLVTITGPGGVGKSRVALDIASRLLSQHPNGAWVIALVDLSDATLIVGEAIYALGLASPTGTEPLDTLCRQLASWDAVLIFDNCEHVAPDVAVVIRAILHAAPNLKVIATSRSALGVAGEAVYRIEPMVSDEAVRLFMERATAARSDVDLSDNETMREICERLERIPLCLELAAARLATMSTQDVVTHLDHRLQLLTRGDATATPHHETLHSTIDWSYQLLNESEQRVYRRMSVFRGGWAAEAAEAVCGTADRRSNVFDVLHALASHSVIDVQHIATGSRFFMLEAIREHAELKLQEAKEERTAKTAHVAWLVGKLTDSEPALAGASDERRLVIAELVAELDNVRAAVDWAVDNGHAAKLLDALSRAFRFFWYGGHVEEGAMMLDRLLRSVDDMPPELEDRGLVAACTLLSLVGDVSGAADPVLRSAALRLERDSGGSLSHLFSDDDWPEVAEQLRNAITRQAGSP